MSAFRLSNISSVNVSMVAYASFYVTCIKFSFYVFGSFSNNLCLGLGIFLVYIFLFVRCIWRIIWIINAIQHTIYTSITCNVIKVQINWQLKWYSNKNLRLHPSAKRPCHAVTECRLLTYNAANNFIHQYYSIQNAKHIAIWKRYQNSN